jgi:hypothetical protein
MSLGSAADTWLRRSGQEWKLTWSTLAALVAGVLILVGYLRPYRLGAVPALFGLPVFAVAVTLRFFIQCRVCGLRLLSSSEGRKRPNPRRALWLRALDTCPVCGDDGGATKGSRERWMASRRPAEEPYWSMRRLGWALLAIVSFLAALGTFAYWLV